MKSSNTIEREIARLYKIGKTSTSPYCPSQPAQTFMNMYLVHKYDLNNPFHKIIIDEYKRYGRISERYIPWILAPEHYVWDLVIYFDKSGKLVSHNADDIIGIFRDNLIDMTELNPGKKIALELGSSIWVDNVCTSGHSEMIIYDPAFNTVEYVDTNNLPKQCSRKDKEYFIWCEIRSEMVRKIVSKLPSNPILITNSDIYGGYDWGIQSLEAASDLLTENEKEGLCLMWSHLFADLALQFPEVSIKEIVTTMIKKAKSKTVGVKFINDYMLFIIRGYISDISNIYGIDFSSIESLRDGCCRIAEKL